MILWLIIAIVLSLLGIVDGIVNNAPTVNILRTVVLFLLVLGMSYRIYLREKDAEKEHLKQKLRDLEDKMREKEFTS